MKNLFICKVYYKLSVTNQELQDLETLVQKYKGKVYDYTITNESSFEDEGKFIEIDVGFSNDNCFKFECDINDIRSTNFVDTYTNKEVKHVVNDIRKYIERNK